MLIKTITGLLSDPAIKLQGNIAALLIVKNGTFSGEKITAKVTRPNVKDEHHSVNLQMYRLGEMAAQEEGFLLSEPDGSGNTHMYIQIGNNGGIKFDEKKQLVVDLKELDNTSTYKLYTIGGYKETNELFVFDRGVVDNGTTSKPVNLEGVIKACVQHDSVLDTVKVDLKSHSNEHPWEELQSINNLLNDVVTSSQTNIGSAGSTRYGFINLLKIPNAEIARSMTIITTGSGEIEYFIQRVVKI